MVDLSERIIAGDECEFEERDAGSRIDTYALIWIGVGRLERLR
jgi:hypothetical protein